MWLMSQAKNRARVIIPLLRRQYLNEHILLMQEAFADGMLTWGSGGTLSAFPAISKLYVVVITIYLRV